MHATFPLQTLNIVIWAVNMPLFRPRHSTSCHVLQESRGPHSTHRTLDVTSDGQSHTIQQVHFTAWPDYGVPADPAPFRAFIAQVHVLLFESHR